MGGLTIYTNIQVGSEKGVCGGQTFSDYTRRHIMSKTFTSDLLVSYVTFKIQQIKVHQFSFLFKT